MSPESDPGSDDGESATDGGLAERVADARNRLYRRGATEKDLEAYRSLAQSASADTGRTPAGLHGGTGAALHARGHAGRRGLRLRVGLLVAGLVIAVPIAANTMQHASPTPEPSSTRPRFDLSDVTLQQRLTQYPSTVVPEWQGAAIAVAKEKARAVVLLPVPDRFLGRELLLVVRCASASRTWRAQVFSSTYGQAHSLTSSGPCGQIGTMVLPAGSGAVSVQVRGDLPFAAALLSHPRPTEATTRKPDDARQ